MVLEAYYETKQKFKFEKLERASLRGRSYIYARVSKLKALRFRSHKFLRMNRSPQLALAMTNKRAVLAKKAVSSESNCCPFVFELAFSAIFIPD
jgi:hypothetical protein